MPVKKELSRTTELIVLLAHGFEASLVTEITTQGRLASHPVLLVGMTIGPVRSDLGISLNPDRTLEQLPPLHSPVVLFPGGKACAMALLRDPRAHRLCEEAWTKGGQVVAVASVLPFLREAGIRVTDIEKTYERKDRWSDLLHASA